MEDSAWSQRTGMHADGPSCSQNVMKKLMSVGPESAREDADSQTSKV